MESKQIILGIVTAAFVFGAYFLGLFQGQQNPARWREFFQSATNSLTRRGFAWVVALPACWVLLYYGLMTHIWFSLGRWPRFGEKLNIWLLSAHDDAVRYFFGGLVYSLYAAAMVLVVCLFLRKWRHVSVYALCYGAAVGLASCALFLAPHAFLNWLFD